MQQFTNTKFINSEFIDMELISKQSWSAPIITIIDSILSPEQQRTFKALQKRKIYIYKMGIYLRMLPSARTKLDFFIWDVIPSSILAELREDRADLILDISIESLFMPGYDAKSDLIEIYKGMRELNIPPSRIILAHSNLTAPQYHDSIVAEIGVKEPMRLWTLDFAMAYTSLQLEKDPAIRQRIELAQMPRETNNKNELELKHFLYLNRKIKFHRTVILLALLAHFDESKILFSFKGGDEKNQSALKGTLDKATKFLSKHNNLFSNIDWQTKVNHLIKEFPIILPETESYGNNKTYAFRSIDAKWYDNTFMSIVGETFFTDSSTLFLTEKVIKPIYWSHPFIVIGDPGTLARLKALGFRTFNKIIDESYDDIYDPDMRLLALIDELKRIGSFSHNELIQARNALEEDIQFNFDYICNGFHQTFARLFIESFAEVVA